MAGKRFWLDYFDKKEKQAKELHPPDPNAGLKWELYFCKELKIK